MLPINFDIKSYLIGVFDGEGSISAYFSKKGNTSLSINLSMANEEIIDLFRQVWGGGKHKKKTLTTGGLQLYQWYICASNAIPFLEYAKDVSRAKNKQAEIALKIAQEMSKYKIGAGTRKGVNLRRGESFISIEEKESRTKLVLEMRSLNGARSRFAPITTS